MTALIVAVIALLAVGAALFFGGRSSAPQRPTLVDTSKVEQQQQTKRDAIDTTAKNETAEVSTLSGEQLRRAAVLRLLCGGKDTNRGGN